MEPHPDIPDFAQCSSCKMWIEGRERCFWLSKNKKVDGDDSCIMYGQGKPMPADTEPTGILTPEEVGFFSGQTRCENCNAFDARDKSRLHCDLYVQLTRMFPRLFKLDEKVKPRGCCNAMAPGKRDPKLFGPYGPMPDADDPNAGGMLFRFLRATGGK